MSALSVAPWQNLRAEASSEPPADASAGAPALRLVPVQPLELPLGGVLPSWVIESWESALGAAARALATEESEKVFAPAERNRRRRRLAAERDWLRRVEAMHRYETLPRIRENA
jgi:hypothetical protein